MSGRHSRNKGATFEREVVNLFRDHGLKAERVPLSGQTTYAKDDVIVTPAFANEPWRGECKRRKDLPQWLSAALGDCQFLALRADRHEAVVVIRLTTFAELLQ